MNRRRPVGSRSGRRSRMGIVDLAAEAVAGVIRRPMRSTLTALGTVLGVGSFVATLGLTSTAAAQIGGHFDRLKATEVVVQDGRPAEPGPVFPADATQRLLRLNGVRSAGVIWTVPADDRLRVQTSPGGHAEAVGIPVVAASPGALAFAGAVTREGRLFDEFHNRRGEAVAVVGAAAARRLGVRGDRQQAIFLAGRAFTVIGVISDVDRREELLLSVVLPEGTAGALFGAGGLSPEVLIRTQLGAAQLVGAQAPIALRPQDPARLVVVVPPDPRSLRGNIETDVNTLFLLLAGVSLTIGAIGIANTTMVSVLERTPEIGLRRALGAARRHIAAQFLAESAVLGFLGGLIGTSLGLIVIVAVAMSRQWTTVVEPMAVLPAPLIGTAVGLVAGLYPAIRAATVEPADALRR